MEKDIKERVSLLEQSYKTLHKVLEETCCEIKDIKERLLSRPSWAIMLIISSLTTICGSLLVYIVTK